MAVNKMMGQLMDDDRIDDVLIVMDEVQRIGDRCRFPMVHAVDGMAVSALHGIRFFDNISRILSNTLNKRILNISNSLYHSLSQCVCR